MKIGLVIYDSIDTITGGYIYNRNLVDFLESKNIQVKIFSQPKANFFKRIISNFSKTLTNEILQFSPNLLLEDKMNFISLFLLNKKLKRHANFPIISIVHSLNFMGVGFFKYLFKIIEYSYFKSVDGFIFNSFSMQRMVVNMFGDCSSSLVAYPGKDRIKCSITESQILVRCFDKPFKIIFVGNLHRGKGLHTLIKALSRIDTHFWSLSVVGSLHFDLKYTKKILKMICQLKLKNNVRILGVLDQEEISKEIISHHILAVPSFFEGYGIVYAEAMSAGLPVIASQSGGASEIVTDSVTGFLVAPDDVIKIKNHILKLIENRELLLKMSLSSLSASQDLSTWNESMEKVHSFCRKIADSAANLN